MDVPVIDVLIIEGLHVPLIPLLEVLSNAGAIEFSHNGAIGVNVGVILGLTVIVKLQLLVQLPVEV